MLSTNDDFPTYTKNVVQLIGLVNTLRGLGAHVDLDLPTVVVCGNQSVGKSSVMEAICGIPLPRGIGTCTRCVIEARLSRAASWSCTIKLRREYDNHGNQLQEIKEEVFGPPLSSASTLELQIRRAQKALLNPSKNSSVYLTASFPDQENDNQLKFTKNVVCLDILGAPTTLTLIDLPGIIHSVEKDEDQVLIDMIEELVKMYISKERAIILAVISCKDDIENQAIFHLARQVDPLGYRTIGILTKPDTIETGTHDKWLSVLSGNQYSLKSGYYMIKCPNKMEQSAIKRIADGIMLEKEYFQRTQPWSSLQLHSNRFGIPSLRAEVTKILASLVESSIPDMRKATEKSLEEVNAVLERLPPPITGDGKIELLQSIRQFSTLINYHINSQQNLKAFNQKIRKHFDNYRDHIQTMRPKLAKSAVKKEQAAGYFAGALFGRGANNEETPTLPQQRYSYTISDLQNLVSSQRGKELDGTYPYGALETLVEKFQEDWKTAAINLILQISQELKNLIVGVTDDVFARFTQLQAQVRVILNSFQAELQRITIEQVYTILSMEMKGPFTLQSSRYMRTKSECLDALMNNTPMFESNISNEKLTAMKRAMNSLSEVGIQGLTIHSMMNRLTTTNATWTSEIHLLDLLASAIAYFDIASWRFADTTCMAIEHYLLGKFGSMLEKELIHHLNILNKSQMEIEQLLKEDWGVLEKRTRAQERQLRLTRVWKSLQEFGMAHN